MLEARAYRQAKVMYDAADNEDAVKRLPKTPLMSLVRLIEFEVVQEGLNKT